MTLLRPLLFLCTLCLLPGSHAYSDELANISLSIGSINLHAELADTPQNRARGLMQRTVLCADCGMLFVFEEAGKHELWMKDTPLPLSVAFIAQDGRILNIEEMQANSLKRYVARGPALYALEMNQGWFSRHAITPGNNIQKIQGLYASH